MNLLLVLVGVLTVAWAALVVPPGVKIDSAVGLDGNNTMGPNVSKIVHGNLPTLPKHKLLRVAREAWYKKVAGWFKPHHSNHTVSHNATHNATEKHA